jgi:glycosyltransferase involved in cell wall biosynthesis
MLAEAHFMILPTRAETFGSATCEVNAYGLPTLVNDVGGTSGAVANGVNGQRFDPDASPAMWRDAIAELWSDPKQYAELAMSSQAEFANRLNWPTGCRALIDMLQET